MKRKRYLQLLIICLVSIVLRTDGQTLYSHLPDSLKPANAAHITAGEADKILINFYRFGQMTQADMNELDALIPDIHNRLDEEKSWKNRVNFLSAATLYLLNHGAYDSALRYSKYYEKAVADIPDKKKATLSRIQAVHIRGNCEFSLEHYSSAYRAYKSALDLALQTGSYSSASNISTDLSELYLTCLMPEKARSHAQDALRYNQLSAEPKPKFANKALAAIVVDNIMLGDRTGKVEYCDSALAAARPILRSDASSFGLKLTNYSLSSLCYYRKKMYALSAVYADSALQFNAAGYDFSFKNESLNLALAFKGLSMIRMGNVQGYDLLKQVRYDGNIFLNPALDDMYQYARQKGFTADAFRYLEARRAADRHEIRQDYRARLFEIEQQYDAGIQNAEIRSLKSKEQRNAWMSGAVITIILSILFLLFAKYRRNRKKLEGTITLVNDLMLREINNINKSEEIRKNERQRIAQEMHHDFSATIAAAANFMRAKAISEENPADKRRFDNIAGILQESYDRARNKSHLTYRQQNYSFAANLEQTIRLFFSNTNIEADVIIEKSGIDELGTDVQAQLVLWIKEGITNIIRHSRAGKAWVTLCMDQDNVILELGDDGRGFPAGKQSGGLGIGTIRNQVKEMGGFFHFDLRKPAGTIMNISLPVQAAVY